MIIKYYVPRIQILCPQNSPPEFPQNSQNSEIQCSYTSVANIRGAGSAAPPAQIPRITSMRGRRLTPIHDHFLTLDRLIEFVNVPMSLPGLPVLSSKS